MYDFQTFGNSLLGCIRQNFPIVQCFLFIQFFFFCGSKDYEQGNGLCHRRYLSQETQVETSGKGNVHGKGKHKIEEFCKHHYEGTINFQQIRSVMKMHFIEDTPYIIVVERKCFFCQFIRRSCQTYSFIPLNEFQRVGYSPSGCYTQSS